MVGFPVGKVWNFHSVRAYLDPVLVRAHMKLLLVYMHAIFQQEEEDYSAHIGSICTLSKSVSQSCTEDFLLPCMLDLQRSAIRSTDQLSGFLKQDLTLMVVMH